MTNNQEESRAQIQLRYALEYVGKDGHRRTIEMSLPLPVGANAQTRERLIREAEIGMNELIMHVEAQALQLATRPAGQKPEATPPATPPPTPQNRTAPSPATPPLRPADKIPPTPLPSQEQPRKTSPAQEVEVPPTRQTIGASMPATMNPGLDNGGSLPLPEFIRYIKQNMGLNPPDAMRLLNTKSLSGVNLREALERLRQITSAQGNIPPIAREPEAPRRDPQAAARPEMTPVSRPAPLTEEIAEQSEPRHDIIEMRVARPAVSFDEEIGPEEEEELDLAEPEELDTLPFQPTISPQLLARATAKLGELRESQGAAVASVKRLQVLHTVTDTQIEEEQLQALIEGVWNINTLKKLKVDQVEALISWAKEDYFAEEVEALLSVIEEEHYARGNR